MKMIVEVTNLLALKELILATEAVSQVPGYSPKTITALMRDRALLKAYVEHAHRLAMLMQQATYFNTGQPI